MRVAAAVEAPMGAGRPCLGRVGPRWGQSSRHPALAHRPCPQTLAAVLTALPRSSPAELTISALSLALLVPVKELNVRFRDKLPTPIPGEIVMVRMAPGSGVRSAPCTTQPFAHRVGAGGCRPLVECSEFTEEKSCASVSLSRPLPRIF